VPLHLKLLPKTGSTRTYNFFYVPTLSPLSNLQALSAVSFSLFFPPPASITNVPGSMWEKEVTERLWRFCSLWNWRSGIAYSLSLWRRQTLGILQMHATMQKSYGSNLTTWG
jgi:hypothetical protein